MINSVPALREHIVSLLEKVQNPLPKKINYMAQVQGNYGMGLQKYCISVISTFDTDQQLTAEIKSA
jgi:hypothetical protein